MRTILIIRGRKNPGFSRKKGESNFPDTKPFFPLKKNKEKTGLAGNKRKERDKAVKESCLLNVLKKGEKGRD